MHGHSRAVTSGATSAITLVAALAHAATLADAAFAAAVGASARFATAGVASAARSALISARVAAANAAASAAGFASPDDHSRVAAALPPGQRPTTDDHGHVAGRRRRHLGRVDAVDGGSGEHCIEYRHRPIKRADREYRPLHTRWRCHHRRYPDRERQRVHWYGVHCH